MALVLPEAVKRDVNNAFAEGHPIIVAGVTVDGEPTVSFRGTAQTLGDSALAFWSRDAAGSTLVASLETHPTVVLVYSNMAEHRFYQFSGKARLNDDPEVDRTVYDNSHEMERQRDPERLGKAIVVELDWARGRGVDGPFMLEANEEAAEA